MSETSRISENLIEEVQQLREENAQLRDIQSRLEKQVDWFQQQFKLAQHRRFGKKSEATEQLQLPLFDDVDINPEDATEEDNDKETITYTRKKNKPGRKLDTSKLPREQQIHDLTDEEKMCACGCAMEKFAEDVSEKIDYIPASVKVIEHICPKYTCRQCNLVKSAKKPQQAMQKCMATTRFVSEVVVQKYENHLPLYRQSKILAGLGADIPDNTLGNWVMGAADALEPLAEAMWQLLPDINYLQADETPLKILKPDKSGYMWGYHSCDPGNRFVMFEFNISRASAVPEKRLRDFHGILQTDAYAGYKCIHERENVTGVGCWDHARRKFVDANHVAGKNVTGSASKILKLINKLYKIERGTKNMSLDEIYALRQEKAKPNCEEIYKLASCINALPKSTLGAALTYLSNQKKLLLAYLELPHVNISNCWMENHIRPFAVGRRNWLFSGNAQSANKAALLYSLIHTCKMNHLDPKRYLAYVLDNGDLLRTGSDLDIRALLPQFIDPKLI